MRARTLVVLSSAALLALIALCVVWEGWLAPLRPGGSWMMLKAVPLLPAVFGVLRGRRYTSQWLSMLSLLYLTEGVLRAADPGLTGLFALIEVFLAVVLFTSTMLHARVTAPSRVQGTDPL
ncbi:MAG: DUF2069 domain-containing protein [Thauera sp.]|jgi:uncharacterized membrane protein